MSDVEFLTFDKLEASLGEIRKSPRDDGLLEMIVRRPEVDKREVLEEGQLNLEVGLVGDNWKTRGSSRTTDGFGHPEMQLNIINTRLIDLVAQDKDRWKLAGDQLYVDMDLSDENLPAGTQLEIGSAVIEITAMLHTGCKKFVSRFGLDAMKFVNSNIGKELKLRGINAKVVKEGTIRTNDIVRKI